MALDVMTNYHGPERRMLNIEMSKVLGKLQDIEIQAAKLEAKLDSHHRAFRDSQEEFKSVTERHNHTLYGNGNVGLTTKFDSLKELPDMLTELRHRVETLTIRMAGWSGGAVVMVFVIKFLFKI